MKAFRTEECRHILANIQLYDRGKHIFVKTLAYSIAFTLHQVTITNHSRY